MMQRNQAFLKVFISAWSIGLVSAACSDKTTLFENLPSSKTNINFKNKLTEKPLLNILYYLYYYNGGGVAVGDVNNDGLTDIYFTANNKASNKLYLNKGNFEFEDITEKAGVAGTADWCSGVTMADVNNDGLLDIYTSAVSQRHGLEGHNELYINNGNGGFIESSAEYGLNFTGYTTQAAFFDYDRDGDLDCYLLNQSQQPHANIVDTINRRKFDPLAGDRFYRNDVNTPAKKFTDVSKQAGIFQSSLGYGLGIGVGDLNNDGWDDIYIGNDFHENDYYYVNNGNGTFSENGAAHFRHYSRFSMGNDVADYNNDGQLDVITVDMLPPGEKILKTYGSDENPDIYKVKIELRGYQQQYSRNCLHRNNGNGESFSETALMSGISATDWSWTPLFADFDNDGNKDLLISSGIVKRPVDLDYVKFVSDLKMKKGMNQTDKYDAEAIDAMPDGSSHPFLFKGDGNYSFQDVSDAWGTAGMKGYYTGAAYADLDNDGDLDLVMNCINSPAVILKNNAPKKNSISISFNGEGQNKFGVGCKVYLFQKDNLQYQQLMLTRGFESSVDTRLHFGIDSLNAVDSIVIVWPNQKYQAIKNVPANTPLIVQEKNATDSFQYTSYFKQPARDYSQLNNLVQWRHKENDFLDYNIQYLIPHAQSTRGPKVAVADVNKDGLDDLFLCGARGQGGCLMIQTREGKFIPSDTSIFTKTTTTEQVDAIFFDANNDGHADLYLASGGNEFEDGNPNLADQLYLNNGKGHFSLTEKSLPSILTNKSCVSVADVDKDGDMDVFIGGLANAKKFGLPQSSYLLLNDGQANFKLADKSLISLDEIGMVTSASFADFNKDGWIDLAVAGEWMPLKLFINNNGAFKTVDVDSSHGLWQTVYTSDINQDGFADILAGNWGHNSKLYAGKNGPLKLYVKDFDMNGSIEQILTYTIDGKEYPFLAKDELERSLPVLKKAYLTYSEVAGKTVDFMFYDLFKDYTELKAETLSSSCFLNDGKGNFKRIDLPAELQLSPVFSFASMNQAGSYMAAGNFYGVIPYEGRYDALSPTTFFFDKKAMTFKKQSALQNIDGEVRDIKSIRIANEKKIMIIARNNREPIFFMQNTTAE